MIKIDKVFRQNRHGRSAGMVEEKGAQLQIQKIRLVADDLQVWVPQENIA
jgi:hypothetical protein